MKKTIFSLLIIGSSIAVCAQDVRNSDSSSNNSSSNNNTNSYNNNQMNNNSMSSNNSYNAYGNVPTNVRSSFQRDYPSANNVNWSQSNEWYHVSYMNNGQAMNTYYNNAGQTFNVALPVMETQVPADVVSRISNTYGARVYDITRTKGENAQDVYLVRILDNNGQIRTERINGEGMTVTDGSMNSNTTNDMSTNGSTTTTTSTTDTTSNSSSSADINTNTDNSTSTGTSTDNTGAKQKDKMKIKTVTPDGKKEILKSKNGKVKTRKTDMNNQNY
jgi:hypothetical protein